MSPHHLRGSDNLITRSHLDTAPQIADNLVLSWHGRSGPLLWTILLIHESREMTVCGRITCELRNRKWHSKSRKSCLPIPAGWTPA